MGMAALLVVEEPALCQAPELHLTSDRNLVKLRGQLTGGDQLEEELELRLARRGNHRVGPLQHPGAARQAGRDVLARKKHNPFGGPDSYDPKPRADFAPRDNLA